MLTSEIYPISISSISRSRDLLEYARGGGERMPRDTQPSTVIGFILEENASAMDSSFDSEWYMQRHQKENCGNRSDCSNVDHPQWVVTETEQGSVDKTPRDHHVMQWVPYHRPSRPWRESDMDALFAHPEIIGMETTIECNFQHQRLPTYQSYEVVIKEMQKDLISELYRPENWNKDVRSKRCLSNMAPHQRISSYNWVTEIKRIVYVHYIIYFTVFLLPKQEIGS